jgi:hypothetical protein
VPSGSRLKAVETQIKADLDARVAAQTPSGILNGVFVSRGHPGENLKREAVWLDQVTYTEEVPLMASRLADSGSVRHGNDSCSHLEDGSGRRRVAGPLFRRGGRG